MFEEVFIRVGLPYKVVGGVRFYERKEVRDALAYLRVVANPDDAVSLRRILNTPRRGIGDRAEACVEAFAGRRADLVRRRAAPAPSEAPGIATRSAKAHRRVRRAARRAARAGRDRRRPRSCWRRCSTAPATSPSWRRAPTRRTRAGSTTSRSWSASPGNTPSGSRRRPPRSGDAAPPCAGFLEQVSLVADADQIPSDDPDHQGVVTLMTLHTAKGLEFPVVFLTGLEDGVFPHLRALGDPPGAGGGAPAGLRRHHPGPAAALPVPGGDPLGLGAAVLQPAVPVPGGAAGRAGPLGAHRGGVHHLVRQRRRRRRRGADRAPGGRRFAGGTPKAAAARRSGSAWTPVQADHRQRAARRRPEAGGRATGSTTSATAWAGCSPSRAHGPGAQAQIDFGDQIMWLVLRHAPIDKL